MMALHSGSGNGRSFLWSWLRDSRSFGAILVAPTATGPTWALMGEDTDTPGLMRMIETVRGRYDVDAKRMLMTGLSDGGTFYWVSGLDHASPFTHLAPVAATFHPLMAEMADAEQLRGLPIFLVHGRLDWMSGTGRAPGQQSVVGHRRRGRLSRDRRSQPLLSPRNERGDLAVAICSSLVPFEPHFREVADVISLRAVEFFGLLRLLSRSPSSKYPITHRTCTGSPLNICLNTSTP